MAIENNIENKSVNTVDFSVSWDEVMNKPTRFAPIDHEHDITWSEVIGKPTEFTPEFHTHDEYAKRYHRHTIEDIIGIEGLNLGGSGEGSADHNHDLRYYTKSQTDTMLSLKADTGHTHDINDLTGLDNILVDCYRQHYVNKEEMIEDEDGFFTCQVGHDLETKELDVKVKDSNLKEMLVDITPISENRIEVLTDVKEDLNIFIKKLNFK